MLRGECAAAAGEAVPSRWYANNPLGLLFAHVSQVIAAAPREDPGHHASFPHADRLGIPGGRGAPVGGVPRARSGAMGWRAARGRG